MGGSFFLFKGTTKRKIDICTYWNLTTSTYRLYWQQQCLPLTQRVMTKENGNITLDDLARLVTQNHEETQKRFDNVDERLDKLEHGQEDIKLRLTEVAYKFEVRALEKRVAKLEHQPGRN